MPIDGVFLHFLREELISKILHGRINRVNQINPTDFEMIIHNNGMSYNLFLSTSFEYSTCHLSSIKRVSPVDGSNGHFLLNLRKKLERGFIDEIIQHDNDRVLVFTITNHDEIQDEKVYQLIIGLMGKNSNLILTNDDYQIIDALRFLVNPIDDMPLIIPKAQYTFPQKNKVINPFCDLSFENLNVYEGCSTFLIKSISNTNQLSRLLNGCVSPTLYEYDDKINYYCFNFANSSTKTMEFSTLSSLLDEVLKRKTPHESYDSINLIKAMKKNIDHEKRKIQNLRDDLQKAKNNIDNMKYGILLQNHLHELPKKAHLVQIKDYISDEIITINLNFEKTVIENMNNYFSMGKKGKNALKAIDIQIGIAEKEIAYLESICYFLEDADNNSISEIKNELSANGYLRSSIKGNKQKKKINIQSYSIDGINVLVGKNHLQNDYITNKVAKATDYWFHVKDAPGSHVVLQSNELNEERIRFCSNLAVLNSRAQKSSSVPVDYTQIRYIKKVPGVKGFYVTYTNHKTIYIDPNSNVE